MIRVAGLTKAYNKEKWALRGISVEVQEGEFFGFLGANGAGKTTAIKILTGQLAPTGGEARVMGWEPWKELARVKPFIGVVPDQANLYERSRCSKTSSSTAAFGVSTLNASTKCWSGWAS